MTTLLNALADSEQTVKKSMLTIFETMRPKLTDTIERFQENNGKIFSHPDWQKFPQKNPLLSRVGQTNKLSNSIDKGGDVLSAFELNQYYEQGYIDKKFQFLNLTKDDCHSIETEYLNYKNMSLTGAYEPTYANFPDYVGHLYITSIIKLLHDNYQEIIEKSKQIFQAPEEEIFISVGIFHIDGTGKGINVHQDYTYALLEHLYEPNTSMLTFHTAISGDGTTDFNLYPSTHGEILHTLPTLNYLLKNKIDIENPCIEAATCLVEYGLSLNKLPYNDNDMLALSHYSRYPQLLYAMDKYQENDIPGYQVNTLPGEYILFDPALLHSNGALSWTIDDLVKSAIQSSGTGDIKRLSLAIRVLHSNDMTHRHLWMSAPEKRQTFEHFFNKRCDRNGVSAIPLNKNPETLYTVLSNNKIASPDSPYFSVEEMYNLHLRSAKSTRIS